jgi:hypothetical protein
MTIDKNEIVETIVYSYEKLGRPQNNTDMAKIEWVFSSMHKDAALAVDGIKGAYTHIRSYDKWKGCISELLADGDMLLTWVTWPDPLHGPGSMGIVGPQKITKEH